MIERRRFLAKAGGVAAVAAAAVATRPTSSPSPRSSGGCPRPGPRNSTSFRARPSDWPRSSRR